MGGNACKKYGVQRLTHDEFKKVRDKIYLATSTRATPIESLERESHGDVDFVAFSFDRDMIEQIFNTSDSIVHLGQVDNGEMMTSYALEIDLDPSTRATAQVDVIWINTSNQYNLATIFYSWNGFISYFLNARLRRFDKNLKLTHSGLFYTLELKKSLSSNPSSSVELFITDNVDEILSMCGLTRKGLSSIKSEEELFAWFNRSPLHNTKHEIISIGEHDLDVVNNYFAWNKNQPDPEVDEELFRLAVKKFQHYTRFLPFFKRMEIKKFKTELRAKSLVKFNRVRKIEDYLLRTYFQRLEKLADAEIGYIIKESNFSIERKVRETGMKPSRENYDKIIKSELINSLISKMKQKEGLM